MPIRVIVKFEGDLPDEVQAKAMFDFEVSLRVLSGQDVRVFKERMADDSSLRRVVDMRRAFGTGNVIRKGTAAGKTERNEP